MNPKFEQKLRWRLRDWAVPTTDTLVAVIGSFFEGISDSYQEGYEQGYEQGYQDGRDSW